MLNETDKRMQSDPMFHAFVTLVAQWVERLGLTPHETRQAGYAASMLVEMRAARTTTFADQACSICGGRGRDFLNREQHHDKCPRHHSQRGRR